MRMRALRGVSSWTLTDTMLGSSLHAASAAAALLAGAVVGQRRDVLDLADLEAGTGERTDRRLGSGARGLGLVAARSADADVDGVDTLLEGLLRHRARGLHGRVGRRLVLGRL